MPPSQPSTTGGGHSSAGCDQWIDSQGRTLRFEQRTTLRGQANVNKITFTEFGDPVTVTAPTND
ncbi:hypothetical protein ACFWOG_14930 [Kitasatospora sp. NPDC058406]|uniref:hypothetical protein n=1 Tax=Kitasatospora sp. NPDC058406 TaxID=3346483 RepID=UPI003665089F